MSSEDDDASRIDRKRILEEAAANPDASSAELADRIPDASTEHVEEVLDANEPAGDEDADSSGPEADYPAREDISDRQIRTLQAIAAHPDATQRDIASFLDVTAATVSNRVNSLSGFEWEDRRRFVKEVLDLETIPGGERMAHETGADDELRETVRDLHTRLQRVEARLGSAERDATAFDDPELVRKVVHACMDAEEISDEEEQRILEYFLDR